MFDKVLVANRGEIAIRAFRAAYELGAHTVAVFPYEDRNSLHRLKADQALEIGERGHPVRAYLSVDEIVRAARETGADAIYPGYGFLSENPELARACERSGITFVGPSADILELTGNKARAVARWADVVESVDSDRLVETLDRAVGNALEAGERQRPMEVLLQVSLDEAEHRGGCRPDDVPRLADLIAQKVNVQLRGVMAVAPLGGDPDVAFDTLFRISERLRRDHPDAVDVSAGMSGDLESAIMHGSTRVRVGTALLGSRPLTSP